MEPESSPFTPGQPVPIEYFVGRIAEIESLRGLVKSAVQGKLKIGFMTGERGIGKSSLVSFVRYLVEREEKVAAVHVFLGGVKDLPGMMQTVYTKILRDSIEKPWYQKLAKFFGQRVKQVGLFGISVALQLTEEEKEQLAANFVTSIRQLIDQLGEERKGLLLILDDINGLASSAEFANWLKSANDEIATSNKQINLCIMIVGTEDRKESLVALQPSIARILNPIILRPWNDDETKEFYQNSFGRRAITIDDDALNLMVRYTGGFPVLAQEIGDGVWRNTPVGESRVTKSSALFGVQLAADQLGLKLLEPQVVQAINSERYRSILQKLPEISKFTSFKRSELKAQLTAEEVKVLDNFFRRMEGLGVIVRDDQRGTGYYKFANQLYHLYFYLKFWPTTGKI